MSSERVRRVQSKTESDRPSTHHRPASLYPTKMCCSRAGPLPYAVTTFVSFAVAVVTLIFVVFSYWQPKGVNLFKNDPWDELHLSLVDTRVQLAGWILVLSYQCIAWAFAFASTYSNNPMAGAVRGSMSPLVQFLALIANSGVIFWVVFLDQTLWLRYAVIGLAVTSATSSIAFRSFVMTFAKIRADLTQSTICDFISAQLFIVVGFGFLTSWSVCMVFNHAAIFVLQETQWKDDYIVYGFLGLTVFYCLVWFCMDLCYFRKRTRFAFSPYLSCEAVVAAVFWEDSKRHWDNLTFIIILACLGLILLLIIVKVIVNCVRSSRGRKEEKGGESGHVEAKEFDTYM